MTRFVVERIRLRWLATVIAAVLLIKAPVAAQGPNTLRGRVIDEASQPVSCAQVQMLPGDRRIVTDQRGDFTIAAIENGEYVLRVRRIGLRQRRSRC
jgi:protocatechuate 3,4-dioxygenase beta subunit